MKDMEKEFSEGFIHDMADLLKYCMENKTDSLTLNFDFNGNDLQIDIMFSVR